MHHVQRTCRTRACSMEKQTVARSGFSLVWRRRNHCSQGSLLEDNDYIKLFTDKYSVWLEEGKDFQDPRILWDFIKYKIRYETIDYSKQKARNRKKKLSAVEEKIKKMYSKM